jgi:hypothetical protein
MGRNKRSHRHHYIPEMILRNFLTRDEGLHFWRREFHLGQVKTTTPDNLFLEDELYTWVDDAGEPDVSLEHWFGSMESVGARFINELLAVVRSGRAPKLDEQAWQFVHLFQYYSGKRSPAWHNRFVPKEEVIALAKSLAEERRQTDPDCQEMEEPHDLDRVMKNARIVAQGTPPPDELFALMQSRGLAIYVAPPGASFIVGDHPTAMARIPAIPGGTASGKIAFTPIAYDMAIGYFARPRRVHVDHLTRPQIRTMNEAMARQSAMIAGKSDALVRSLSRIAYQTPEYFTTWDYIEG